MKAAIKMKIILKIYILRMTSFNRIIQIFNQINHFKVSQVNNFKANLKYKIIHLKNIKIKDLRKTIFKNKKLN